jgi:hypothetical protein
MQMVRFVANAGNGSQLPIFTSGRLAVMATSLCAEPVATLLLENTIKGILKENARKTVHIEKQTARRFVRMIASWVKDIGIEDKSMAADIEQRMPSARVGDPAHGRKPTLTRYAGSNNPIGGRTESKSVCSSANGIEQTPTR